MIYKRCPHCKKRVPEGEKCGCGYKRGSCTTLPDGRRQGQQSLAFILALIRTHRSMENLNMLLQFITSCRQKKIRNAFGNWTT